MTQLISIVVPAFNEELNIPRIYEASFNSAPEILAVLGYFFADVEVSRFPTPWHHLSFYTVAVASSPRLDRCRTWRSHRSGGIA